MKARTGGGRRDDNCDHGLSRRSLRVKAITRYPVRHKISYKLKVAMKKIKLKIALWEALRLALIHRYLLLFLLHDVRRDEGTGQHDHETTFHVSACRQSFCNLLLHQAQQYHINSSDAQRLPLLQRCCCTTAAAPAVLLC